MASRYNWQVSEEIGMMIDIFPTFMSLADITYADNSIDGKNIVEMVTNGGKSLHKQVFWEYNGQLAIRQAKWKLVLNGKLDFQTTVKDCFHLSDLEKDPGERINLAEDFPELKEQMATDLKQWYEDIIGKALT